MLQGPLPSPYKHRGSDHCTPCFFKGQHDISGCTVMCPSRKPQHCFPRRCRSDPHLLFQGKKKKSFETDRSRGGAPSHGVGEALLDLAHALVPARQHALVPLGVEHLRARVQPHRLPRVRTCTTPTQRPKQAHRSAQGSPRGQCSGAAHTPFSPPFTSSKVHGNSRGPAGAKHVHLSAQVPSALTKGPVIWP